MMALSSISPLFVLLAILGDSLLPDYYFEIGCAVMVIVPNFILGLRIRIAKRNEGPYERQIGRTDSHIYHSIIYLFVILLPFYRQDIDSLRELTAVIVALIIMVFLFWRFNLHYMNLYFIIRGYHVFTVYPPEDAGSHTDDTSWTLITRRSSPPIGKSLIAYRISDTVYLEN